MVSIIICSINEDYLQNVRKNISDTIGVEYELLVWDNRGENRGICEIYNRMAGLAKFPCLCFLHEDVIITTPNWGGVLISLLRERPDAGVVGIAGSAYKSAAYSGWLTGTREWDFFNYTHRINGVDYIERQPSDDGSGCYPVVCIDGVMIVCRREVWQDIRFDEEGLKAFHFYDIDFSLRAAGKYGVFVTMGIDLVHITQGGDYGDRWVATAMQYHSKQHGRLPYFLKKMDPVPDGERTELKIARLWLDRLKTEKISMSNKLKWIRQQRLDLRGPSLWYPIVRFLVFRPLRLQRIRRLLSKKKHTTH